MHVAMLHVHARSRVARTYQTGYVQVMAKSVMESSSEPGSESAPVKKPATTHDNEGLLTRFEAADLLGVSVSEIRRREAMGTLPVAKRNAKGWVLFHPEALAIQPRAIPTLTRKSIEPYTPEEAARVFDALDEGKSLVQCVRECMVLPAIVELIAIAYDRLTGGMRLSKATMDVINGLSLEGTFPLRGEADMLAVLQTAAKDTCKTCDTRARVFCKPCALKVVTKAMQNPL